MSSGSNKLLRVLGLAFGLAAVVGSIVGQGILRTPGIVAEATSSPAVIIAIWVTGAMVAIISASAFAELGAAIPRAGGAYAFIYRAFGEKLAVLAAFTLLLTYLVSISMLALVTGEFMVRLGMGGGGWSDVELGLGVILLFAILNALGTRTTGGSQIVFSAIKGMILIGLVVALFSGSPAEVPVETQNQLLRNGWLPLGTALLVVVGTYNGWWDVVFYGEEIENPGKQIPRALFGGIIGVAVLYLMINIAMLYVMTPDQMAGSKLVAADAAGIVFGEQADYLLTLFGVLSVGAIGNLMTMTSTRLVYALARAQILPQFMTYVDKRGTPMPAMLFAVLVAAAFILIGGYEEISSLGISINQGITLLAIMAVIGLRKSEPDLERPFKTPWYPWTIIVAVALNTIFLLIFVAQDPWYGVSGFVLVGTLWVIYIFVLKRRAVLEPIEEEN
ncbi:APC family permease [Altererythrobacter sp. MF3-039]|uniref:APC family permease n=1 Tax=Altererythrobacter sp. MF3-039 TaxID=3252901 RepID=UPI00390CD3D2